MNQKEQLFNGGWGWDYSPSFILSVICCDSYAVLLLCPVGWGIGLVVSSSHIYIFIYVDLVLAILLIISKSKSRITGNVPFVDSFYMSKNSSITGNCAIC